MKNFDFNDFLEKNPHVKKELESGINIPITRYPSIVDKYHLIPDDHYLKKEINPTNNYEQLREHRFKAYYTQGIYLEKDLKYELYTLSWIKDEIKVVGSWRESAGINEKTQLDLYLMELRKEKVKCERIINQKDNPTHLNDLLFDNHYKLLKEILVKHPLMYFQLKKGELKWVWEGNHSVHKIKALLHVLNDLKLIKLNDFKAPALCNIISNTFGLKCHPSGLRKNQLDNYCDESYDKFKKALSTLTTN